MDSKKSFKQELLAQLYAPYKHCTCCPLGKLGRSQVVFGEGNPDTKLMLIGEGPGRDEDLQGRPFVGRSGKLLTRSLEAIGITRKDIFITNIVKCRPPNNRAPTEAERMTCKKILLSKQIKIIQPKVICTLGASSLLGLLDKDKIKITQVRGKKMLWEGIIILPTYHPAYILRNPKELGTLIADLTLAQKLSEGGG